MNIHIASCLNKNRDRAVKTRFLKPYNHGVHLKKWKNEISQLSLLPNYRDYAKNISKPFGSADNGFAYISHERNHVASMRWSSRLRNKCHKIVRNLFSFLPAFRALLSKPVKRELFFLTDSGG